ncbi:MAG: helix-turn-helix domain-containing protein [Ignavibacteria bacterium]
MTQEWIIKTLSNLGLSLVDAKIYYLIASNGPLTAKKIADTLKLSRQHVYRTLRRLQKRDLITSTINRSAVFSALTFDDVLDLFMKAKWKEASALSNRKDELLLGWRLMIEKERD